MRDQAQILAVRWREVAKNPTQKWFLTHPPICHTTLYTSEAQAIQDIIAQTKQTPSVRPCGLGLSPSENTSIVLAYQFPISRESKIWEALAFGPLLALFPYGTSQNGVHQEYAALTNKYGSEKNYPRTIIDLGVLLPPA